jgi:quinol monooxygenase YgiN
MIFVIATIEVKPGKREAFLAEFHKLMPKVHAEKGCIEYGPAVDAKTDIKAQIPLRKDTVTIVEKWESLKALQAHLAAPHMGEYREAVKDLVKGVTLQILQPA